jgi:hypothetical protein
VAGTRWPQYLVAVDQIERETGYDFLPLVSAAVADVLEARPAVAP